MSALTRHDIIKMAANALGIVRDFDDLDTDKSKEARVLRENYPTALSMTLADLDIDSASETRDLQLHKEDPNTVWRYAYRYPLDCVRFRRIESGFVQDNRSTRIPYKIGMIGKVKCIFTNHPNAVGYFQTSEVSVASLSYHTGVAISYQLALLSPALINGKGADKLKVQLRQSYINALITAQAHDHEENFQFPDDLMESEFLQSRFVRGYRGV